MLDALKFAFEILIIGALAMPWMAVLCRMFPGRDAELRFDLAFIPAAVRNGVEIAVVLAFGYLLGSAISRFSRDFFNDEMWQPLPTEDVIRDNIYFDEYCRGPFFTYKYWAEPVHLQPLPHFCPPATKSFHELSGQISTDFDELVQEVFRLQDSALLLQGTEKVDRLKQYFDQINILRGAAFNGFILFSLALFGGIGDLKRRWATHPAIALVVYLPAVARWHTLCSVYGNTGM